MFFDTKSSGLLAQSELTCKMIFRNKKILSQERTKYLSFVMEDLCAFWEEGSRIFMHCIDEVLIWGSFAALKVFFPGNLT
jgi:hypothetical protein